MPIHKIEIDRQNIRLWETADRSIVLRLGQFIGNLAQKRVALETALQAFLDSRQLIADLPDDDPDKYVDPGRPDLFWDGLYLVGRAVRVTVEVQGAGASATINVRLQRTN